MQTIQFNPKISIDFQDLMKGLSELSVSDLEHLIDELNQVIEQRKSATTEYKANQLVQKIEQGEPSKEFHEKLMELFTKSVKETISEEEHSELLKMIPIAENWTAKRLAYLIELSQLWGISVDAVMEKLNIQEPPTIYA